MKENRKGKTGNTNRKEIFERKKMLYVKYFYGRRIYTDCINVATVNIKVTY